ncbi:hypothetical protein CS387_04015 [Porphyromonas gingivalis]|nr:hypothetical protein CS387_04015 [Porphyromonas gingivalis]
MVVEGDCLLSFKRGISAPFTQYDVHKSMFIAYLTPLKKEKVSYIYKGTKNQSIDNEISKKIPCDRLTYIDAVNGLIYRGCCGRRIVHIVLHLKQTFILN